MSEIMNASPRFCFLTICHLSRVFIESNGKNYPYGAFEWRIPYTAPNKVTCIYTAATGSPKKHETWKTTWGLLIDILIRMKGPSIETDMRNFSLMLTEFYSNI